MQATHGIEGICTLDHWGVIRAAGSDAAAFLHSQLTNDVVGLDAGRARLAGFCSAKGRLQATFVMWKAAHEEILLACARDLLPAVLKRLSMFVLRAKCKLSDASTELSLRGIVGAPARTLGGDIVPWGKLDAGGATLIRLPDADGVPRLLHVAAAEAPAPSIAAMPLAHWRWLEVRSGIPTVEAATVEAFVPQMINFELIGGVDFKKGCYPGQEVVARSQYRGTIKRRMAGFDVAAPATPGQEIFHSADPGQPAGLVVNAAPRPDGEGSSVLVEIKLAALADGSLHLGSADGAALVPRPLPYVLPAEPVDAA